MKFCILALVLTSCTNKPIFSPGDCIENSVYAKSIIVRVDRDFSNYFVYDFIQYSDSNRKSHATEDFLKLNQFKKVPCKGDN